MSVSLYRTPILHQLPASRVQRRGDADGHRDVQLLRRGPGPVVTQQTATRTGITTSGATSGPCAGYTPGTCLSKRLTISWSLLQRHRTSSPIWLQGKRRLLSRRSCKKHQTLVTLSNTVHGASSLVVLVIMCTSPIGHYRNVWLS